MNRIAQVRDWLWRQPAVLLSLTVFFWSANIVVGRAVAGIIPPVALAQLRWMGAALIVLPFAWAGLRREWPIIRANFGILTILSITGISAYNTVAYWGVQHTEAINANLLQPSATVAIAFWSFVLFRERLTRDQTIGIVVATVGAVVIVSRGDLRLLSQLEFNIGDVAFTAALVIYALYTSLLRLRPGLTSLTFLSFTLLWGAIMLLPVFLAELFLLERRIEFQPLTGFALVYVMVFPSILAYLFYNRAVGLVGANRAAPAFFLFPVFGAILSILFLGESIELFHIGGSALIVGGVFITLRSRDEKPS